LIRPSSHDLPTIPDALSRIRVGGGFATSLWFTWAVPDRFHLIRVVLSAHPAIPLAPLLQIEFGESVGNIYKKLLIHARLSDKPPFFSIK
jgi:hypothetical protein